MLSLIALLMGSCAGEPSPPLEEVSPTPGPHITDFKVTDATEAQDIALAYLQERELQNAPDSDIIWQEESLTPPGLVGGVTKVFTSDEWAITVSYAVLPPDRIKYKGR